MACSWVASADNCKTSKLTCALPMWPNCPESLPTLQPSQWVVSPILIVGLPVPQPSNVRQYDMTLKQKSHDRPEFTKISNAELMSKVVGAL